MTEEELKALPPDPVVIIEADDSTQKPKPAADEAAGRFQLQLKAAEDRAKAATETAESERNARIAAENRARGHEQEAKRFQGEAQSAELQAVSTALDGATRERDMAKTELRRALEAGEMDKVADAQSTLATAAARIVNLERDKAYYAAQTPKTEGRVEVQPQQRDLTEEFISSATPATQAWLRQHREFVVKDRNGTPKLSAKVLAAHYEAEDQGIQAESPEYFAYLEGKVKPQATVEVDEGQPAPTPKPQQRQVAAPVSRDVQTSNGKLNTKRITLTAGEVEAAHMFGDPKKTEREREIDYWNNKQALVQEGRIGTQH